MRLSGLEVSMPTIFPLSQLKELVDSGQYNSIDLIHELGGRGRFHVALHAHPSPTGPKAPSKPVAPAASSNSPQQSILQTTSVPDAIDTNETYTVADAYKITGLPDTYELKNDAGISIGRAAVQNAKVSISLRAAFTAQIKHVKVNIEWHDDFKRYKIIGLAV